MMQFGGVGERKEDESLWVLAFHFVERPGYSLSQNWTAVAVFHELPTEEQILSLYNFKEGKSFDKAIARTLVKHQYCAMFYGPRGTEFKRDKKGQVLYSVAEYMLVHPKSNGDLLLFDYLHTGYCDFPEHLGDKAVYYQDYIDSKTE